MVEKESDNLGNTQIHGIKQGIWQALLGAKIANQSWCGSAVVQERLGGGGSSSKHKYPVTQYTPAKRLSQAWLEMYWMKSHCSTGSLPMVNWGYKPISSMVEGLSTLPRLKFHILIPWVVSPQSWGLCGKFPAFPLALWFSFFSFPHSPKIHKFGTASPSRGQYWYSSNHSPSHPYLGLTIKWESSRRYKYSCDTSTNNNRKVSEQLIQANLQNTTCPTLK